MVALLGDANVGTIFVALLMTSLMGTLLGFLVYNWNPARIFMGDSGSYFLGYLLATSSIMAPLQKASTAVSLLVPVVALGLPIFDTLFSMLRRYLERRPVFAPDRGHVHHRLIDMGITHRRAVVTLYGACIVLAASAVAIALGRDWEKGLGLLGASVVVVGLIRAVGQIERSRRVASLGPEEDARARGLRALVPGLPGRLSRATTENELAEFLEAIRIASDAHAICLVLDDAELARAGAEPSDAQGVLCVPLAQRGRMELRYEGEADVGPRAEALLLLLADQLAVTLPRLQTPGSPMPPQEARSGKTRAPS
jgi:UDP-GlcNAc:undecaprenyl-phosphate GlcNAc-1-phosphate transferase